MRSSIAWPREEAEVGDSVRLKECIRSKLGEPDVRGRTQPKARRIPYHRRIDRGYDLRAVDLEIYRSDDGLPSGEQRRPIDHDATEPCSVP